MTMPIDTAFNARQALAIQPDRNVNPKDAAGLKRTCRQFEAVFVQNMLKHMRATVPEGGLFEKGNDYQMYRDMLDAQIAKEAADRGTFGIGDQLYNHFKKPEPTNPPADGLRPKIQVEDED